MRRSIPLALADSRAAAPVVAGARLIRTSLLLRGLLVILLCLAAYQYSLATLLVDVGHETPLAYVGLVPVIALVTIAGLLFVPHHEPDIHDRYLDYIIGLPLLGTAMVMLLLVPVRLSVIFWAWRLDLLSLPFFVAGAICLAFGVRMAWRLRYGLALLVLAWPLPYMALTGSELQVFAGTTISALRGIVAVVPIAQPVPGGDGSFFLLSNARDPFIVSVASACTGFDGLVGFALIGTAAMVLVRGTVPKRIAWLVSGLVVIWLLDVVRILLLFEAGAMGGQDLALRVLHPYVGLVMFNIGVLLMLVLLPVFGLEVAPVWPQRHGSAPRPERRKLRHADVALGLLLLCGLLAAAGDADLRRYDLTTTELGVSRLRSDDVANATVSGWMESYGGSFPWVRAYFGSQATWTRYIYAWQPQSGGASLQSPAPVTVDIIQTADISSLAVYGVETCYRVHDYQVYETSRGDLGAGVIGRTVIYWNRPMHSLWSAVYWEWPVSTTAGLRYQRVVLNMTAPVGYPLAVPSSSTSALTGLTLAAGNGLGGSSGRPPSTEAAVLRDFLVAFGRAIIQSTTEMASTRRSSA